MLVFVPPGVPVSVYARWLSTRYAFPRDTSHHRSPPWLGNIIGALFLKTLPKRSAMVRWHLIFVNRQHFFISTYGSRQSLRRFATVRPLARNMRIDQLAMPDDGYCPTRVPVTETERYWKCGKETTCIRRRDGTAGAIL